MLLRDRTPRPHPCPQWFGDVAVLTLRSGFVGSRCLSTDERKRGKAEVSERQRRREEHQQVCGGALFRDDPDDCATTAFSKGYVVKARVLVGKSKALNAANFESLEKLCEQYSYQRLQEEGYDSVSVAGLEGGECFIVYNKDQVELVVIERMSE
eukprot:TRINITY_DN21532_c0_g1_i1.p1 TRINITY_DN21532_c0_g1~~TRINITY_DN21532_c0_g1_i1.p1  ORF type:complete len:154 (+),score=18.72 TRINITY_DN21532_c0_g1_i1:2-463(+)